QVVADMAEHFRLSPVFFIGFMQGPVQLVRKRKSLPGGGVPAAVLDEPHGEQRQAERQTGKSDEGMGAGVLQADPAQLLGEETAALQRPQQRVGEEKSARQDQQAQGS